MHEFIFSGISSQHYEIFDRKIDFKPDFRFSINIPTLNDPHPDSKRLGYEPGKLERDRARNLKR